MDHRSHARATECRKGLAAPSLLAFSARALSTRFKMEHEVRP